MKNILAVLLSMPVIAFSQNNEKVELQNIPAYCVTIVALEEMLSKHEELPMIRGKSVRDINGKTVENSLVIFVNMENKSWTITERTQSGKYCVIALGEEFQPVPNNIIEDVIKERQRKRS